MNKSFNFFLQENKFLSFGWAEMKNLKVGKLTAYFGNVYAENSKLVINQAAIRRNIEVCGWKLLYLEVRKIC